MGTKERVREVRKKIILNKGKRKNAASFLSPVSEISFSKRNKKEEERKRENKGRKKKKNTSLYYAHAVGPVHVHKCSMYVYKRDDTSSLSL